jgi:hypothetical protein
MASAVGFEKRLSMFTRQGDFENACISPEHSNINCNLRKSISSPEATLTKEFVRYKSRATYHARTAVLTNHNARSVLPCMPPCRLSRIHLFYYPLLSFNFHSFSLFQGRCARCARLPVQTWIKTFITEISI